MVNEKELNYASARNLLARDESEQNAKELMNSNFRLRSGLIRLRSGLKRSVTAERLASTKKSVSVRVVIHRSKRRRLNSAGHGEEERGDGEPDEECVMGPRLIGECTSGEAYVAAAEGAASSESQSLAPSSR